MRKSGRLLHDNKNKNKNNTAAIIWIIGAVLVATAASFTAPSSVRRIPSHSSSSSWSSVVVNNNNNKHIPTTTVSLESSSSSSSSRRFITTTMMPDEPNPDEPPPNQPPQRRPNPPPLPTVKGESGDQVDVISRLLKDRILLLGTDVNDEVANVLVAQLLYLANNDPDTDITLYINSPGGSVSAGMAIYDTMKFIPCDVCTVCFGMAASMGAFLLGAGTPGKRKSLPNARIMIHQPLGGAEGAASDIEIQAQNILFTKACLNKYIAEYCDQPVEKIAADTDRDFFMTPYEARDYGIIDEVIATKTSHIPLPRMPSLFDRNAGTVVQTSPAPMAGLFSSSSASSDDDDGK